MKATESIVINGYDLLAEHDRVRFPDVVVCGRKLNRGTAVASPRGTPHDDYASLKQTHLSAIMPNTIEPESPVIDYSYPAAGMFVDSPAGVYLDLYQGVAQKLIDEHHPRYQQVIQALVDNGLAFRREINTDDYVTLGDGGIESLHTSQDLAVRMNDLAGGCFPGKGAYRTFFSNSGAESGEAAIKLAQLHAYREFLRRHGMPTFARLMDDLGIPVDPYFDASDGEPCYTDYPFFLIGCTSSFHGRTMGVLNLTQSKKAHQLGFSKFRWVKHIPFNGEVSDFTDLIDPRPITEILDAPGGVREVVANGKVPKDLAALFALECYQGEGGYKLADCAWIHGIAAACTEWDVLLGVDEVQSFARTGKLFAVQHFDVEPDVLWTSKGAVVGITTARADLAQDLHVGWHSNTFGGGKFFDVNMAYTTVDLVTGFADPLFEGRNYLENSHIKGEYLRMRLAEMSNRHPDVLSDFSGLGGMWGLSVRHREEIVAKGWHMGAKLLGCGPAGELSRLRIILLTDVLTREIDQMMDVLDRIFSAVEADHRDE